MKLLLMMFFSSFVTVLSQNTQEVFLDLRDNKEYNTIRVGNQIWFAENFAYIPYVDTARVSVYGYKGNSIAEAKASLPYQKYGALYTWELAKELAPKGWRLPTDADWQQLEKHLGIGAGEVGVAKRNAANNEVHQLNAHSYSGFGIPFGGWRTDDGEFQSQEQYANFWCSDSYDTENAYKRRIGIKNATIGRDYSEKGCGLSVRYVRNMPADEAVFFPDTSWEYIANSESYGWDASKLRHLQDMVKDSTNATGLVVVQSGKILLDFGNIEEVSYIASCRKSLLSMLYGNYVENGTINLQTSLAELDIDDVGGLLPSERTATIADLLQSKSGVFHIASNEGGNEFLFPERGSKKPNTYFVYNNWDFNAAGYIFEQLTGKSIYQAFERDIANNIGCEDWDIAKQYKSGDTTKSKFKAYHFVLSTRDMARVGYLMLRKGTWHNVQVIPQHWVETITTISTSLEEMKTVDPRIKEWSWYKWGYGMMWRIWDSPEQAPELEEAYTATGNMGQYITIIPSLDVVVALKTKPDYGRRTEYDVYEKLLTAIIDAKK